MTGPGLACKPRRESDADPIIGFSRRRFGDRRHATGGGPAGQQEPDDGGCS
jgi:hypothetical protein